MKAKRIEIAAKSIAALAAENARLRNALQREQDFYILTTELFERKWGFYPSLTERMQRRLAALASK